MTKLLTDAEVERMYVRAFGQDSLPERGFTEITDTHETDVSWLGDFLNSTKSYFIEAQRLVHVHYHQNWHDGRRKNVFASSRMQ